MGLKGSYFLSVRAEDVAITVLELTNDGLACEWVFGDAYDIPRVALTLFFYEFVPALPLFPFDGPSEFFLLLFIFSSLLSGPGCVQSDCAFLVPLFLAV